MKSLWTVFRLCERALLLAHTGLAKPRFSSWGAGSRLGLGATLDGPELVAVGANVAIGRHAWLNAMDDRKDGRPTLRIGDGTYIGRFAHINAWREVSIGNNVLIADRVFISDASHNFADANQPIIGQGDSFVGAVELKEGCWIGAGAAILPGVTIGKNAVVGANAVVTKDVPDYAVVAGIPARPIRAGAGAAAQGNER